LALLLFATIASFAQRQDFMSYQAVIRNTANKLVVNQTVGLQISILQGSVSGTAVYVERHTIMSNENGLVTLEIGGGNSVTGSYSTINWASGTYFIKTETDPTGGTSYTISGTSQLMSVPYALYANTSGSSISGPPGVQRATGSTGPQGAQGLTGSTGATGPQGALGPIGATGPKGDQGMIGLTGPQGTQGLIGLTGTKGAQGSIGLTGTAGPQGVQGLTGLTGATGAQGASGPIGATGPKGDQGLIGLTGATGMQGSPGTIGLTGATGAGFENGTAAGQVYLTGSSSFAPQLPVSVSGDVTITNLGVTSIASSAVTTNKIEDHAITTGKISATGTPDATTFLRGDGSWSPPATAGSSGAVGVIATNTSLQTIPVGGQFVIATVSFDSYKTYSGNAGNFNGNTFTVGPTGAGVYLISANVVAYSTGSIGGNIPTQLPPCVIVDGVIAAYGTFSTSRLFPSGFYFVGMVTTIISLNAYNSVAIQVSSTNTGNSIDLSTDGTTRLSIVKLF
jgi:hypothetical protein